jgi:hypothetical protein
VSFWVTVLCVNCIWWEANRRALARKRNVKPQQRNKRATAVEEKQKNRRHRRCIARGAQGMVAERAGFEPAEVLPSHDFQSCAFDQTMLPLLGGG